MDKLKEIKIILKAAGFIVAFLFIAVFIRHYYFESHKLSHQNQLQDDALLFQKEFQLGLTSIAYSIDSNSLNPLVKDFKLLSASELEEVLTSIDSEFMSVKTLVKGEINTFATSTRNDSIETLYVYSLLANSTGEANLIQIDLKAFLSTYVSNGQDEYQTSIHPKHTNPKKSTQRVAPNSPISYTISIPHSNIIITFNKHFKKLNQEFERKSVPFIFMFLIVLIFGVLFIIRYSKVQSELVTSKIKTKEHKSLLKSLVNDSSDGIVLASPNSILLSNQNSLNWLSDLSNSNYIVHNPNNKSSFEITTSKGLLTVKQSVVQLNNHDYTLQILVLDKSEDNQSLKSLEKDLSETKDFKTQLVDRLSRNIRTPLSSLLGMVLFLKESKIDREQAEYIQVIEDMGYLMGDILDDLIDSSDLNAGKTKSKLGAFNLKSQIAAISHFHSNSIEHKDLTFETQYDEKLPSFIISDKAKLRQILNHIIDDSNSHTISGSIKLSVYRKNEQFIRFSVTDTSPGMSHEQLIKIQQELENFKDFTRVKASNKDLGLKIASYYCKLLNSKLHLTSNESDGTKIYFDLPLFESNQKVLVDMIADSTISGNLIEPEKYKILLVEDNKINIKITKKMLEKLSFKDISVAENGRAAIEMVRVSFYDVILMDCNMPVLDGYLATTELRTQGVTTPIIALTGSVSEEDIDKCLLSGMNEHIPKPVELNSLKAVLFKYLKK